MKFRWMGGMQHVYTLQTNMGYLFGWAKRRSWDCVAHCESPATRDVALSPCVIMPNNIPRLDDDDDVSV